MHYITQSSENVISSLNKLKQKQLLPLDITAANGIRSYSHLIIFDALDSLFVLDDNVINLSLLSVSKLVLFAAPFSRQLVLKLHAPTL